MRHFITMMISASLLRSISLFGSPLPGEEGCWDIDLSLYTGYVNGESQELVLNGSHTLSRLDWKITNLWVLGATGRVGLYHDTFHISIDGWNKLSASKSTMIDRDYQNAEDLSQVTEFSEHKDTRLKTAYSIEGEFDYDFYQCCLGSSQTKFGVLIGYKYTKFHWDSHGGTYRYYNYDDDINYNAEYEEGFFDPDESLISFQETFSIPYAGIQLKWQWNDCFDVRGYGKFTNIATIQNKDFHLLRDMIFKDTCNNATYWIAGIEARWNLCAWLALDLKYSYEQLNKATGTTHMTESGENLGYHNGAGCKHRQQLFVAGLTAKF
jgi:outer membrane protease